MKLTKLAAALAVNAVSRIRESRLMNWHAGLDGKRSRAWCEYGFKSDLSFLDYYGAYDRDGLGNAAIELRSDKVFSSDPWIIEGDERAESEKYTATELEINRFAKRVKLWQAMKQAYIMALVGGCSYLILELKDGKRLSDKPKLSAKTLDTVDRVIPVWRNQIEAKERTADGTVTMYQYKEPQEDGYLPKHRDVHPDRLVTVGCPQLGRPMLKAGFNALVTIEKVIGGAGESFLKNASRQMNINYDKEVDLKQIARDYGLEDLGEYQEIMNELAKDINSGVDIAMVTQGANVSAMTVAVSDPVPTFQTALQVFAASVKIPLKILIGNITGERASTEDMKQFNATCQAFRETDVDTMIRALFDRLIALGLVALAEYEVMWSDLTDGDTNEKADTASKVATALQAYAAAKQANFMSGDELPLSDDEFRTLLGYDVNEKA